jgi:ribosome-binding factor A
MAQLKLRPFKSNVKIRSSRCAGFFLVCLQVFLHTRYAVEHRAQKYHRGRLSEAIREEIETILEGELADPRIGLASVSAVLMATDARSARVMVTVAGDEAEAERTLEGLAAAKNFVRHELAERLRLRKPPELYFQIDRADELEGRVDELLTRERKRRRKSTEPKAEK